jgi:hypothetical protein
MPAAVACAAAGNLRGTSGGWLCFVKAGDAQQLPVPIESSLIAGCRHICCCRYSAWDLKRLRVPSGRSVQLQAPVGDIPVHIRGGAIVPMQVRCIDSPTIPMVFVSIV